MEHLREELEQIGLLRQVSVTHRTLAHTRTSTHTHPHVRTRARTHARTHRLYTHTDEYNEYNMVPMDFVVPRIN